MVQSIRGRFERPPRAAKPWTRWWWFGCDVAPSSIAKELGFMASAGFGGVELAFVYAWPGASPGPEPLTPEWIDRVAFAASTAHRAGLEFELTFGSGWPFGGRHIPVSAASKVVAARPASSPLGPGERSLAVLENRSGGAPIRIVQAPSPQRVKRPAPGQEGPVHDHLSPEGFAAHASAWGPAVEALMPEIDGLFCDSWEVAGPYWTDRLPEAFQARHGYDLLSYVPYLLGCWDWPGAPEEFAAIAYDYRAVVSDLALAGFYRPFAAWCAERGLRSRVQAHGSPTPLVDSYGTAAVPETEALLIPLSATRWAASAAHLLGTGPVTSESFTCLYGWPNVRLGAERPDDLKRIADAQFANGMQRVSYHGFASLASEGRAFYAGSHVNDSLTWSASLATLNAAFARACALLQWGEPVRDLAVYDPIHDRWSGAPGAPGPSGFEAEIGRWPDAPWEVPLAAELEGYGFDWVSDSLIDGASWGSDGLRIGKARYRALVLPGVRLMPTETFARLARLSEAGAPILALEGVPSAAPGREGLGKDFGELRCLRSLAELARAAGLAPAVTGDPLPPFCHRRLADGGGLFFIAHPDVRDLAYPLPYVVGAERNVSPMRVALSFRCARRRPEVWDPSTGESWIPEWRSVGHRTEVELELGPNDALFVAFPAEPSDVAEPIVFDHRVPLSSGWRMRMPGAETFEPASLGDWASEPRLADYSGSVDYEYAFEISRPVEGIRLDLGVVEVVAHAWLNGEPLGERLWAPYRFAAAGLVRTGTNHLLVRVSNLPFNALQAARASNPRAPIPGLSERENSHVAEAGLMDDPGVRMPAGLLGPVSLEVRWARG